MAIGTGVYKVSGRGEIFVLENNKWRYVCTEAVLFQAGYSWAEVQTIPIEEWCPYEVGYPMPGGWVDPNNYGYYPHSSWYIEACAVTPPPELPASNGDIIAGGIATALNYYIPTNLNPAKGCDNNLTTRYCSAHGFPPGWWKYDFGAGIARVVTEFRLFEASVDGAKDFTFQGSNDDISWAVLYTGQFTKGSGWKEFTFPNLNAYRYYKISSTTSWGSDLFSFWEIEFMGGEPVYTCPQCGATFGSQAELDEHIATAHPGDWTAQQIQIPIIAWGGGFETLRQTGCNIVYISHPVTDLDWWRQLAQTATEYKIGIMPWVGRGMAGRDDWPDGERLKPEWEAWISMLAEQPSLYGFYAWEEPNVFRQLYGEPTDESMLEQYQVLKRLAPKAKVTGTIGLAEPQYAMNYPQTMDVVFPEWFVSPSLGTEYWTSQYNRLWKPMLNQFKGEVYPFILPSAIEKMSIEEILAGWVALQGPVTGLCYYGGLSNILQQVTAYNALLIPKEVITPKTIIHSCNVKISYQVSSFAENNDALACPNCGMALGVEGIRGSEEIIEVPEVITPHIITCSKCGSQLELKVSSIASKNTEQFCPVCGEPAD